MFFFNPLFMSGAAQLEARRFSQPLQQGEAQTRDRQPCEQTETAARRSPNQAAPAGTMRPRKAARSLVQPQR